MTDSEPPIRRTSTTSAPENPYREQRGKILAHIPSLVGDLLRPWARWSKFLLPHSCLLCGQEIRSEPSAAASAICAPCQLELPYLPHERCPSCAVPTERALPCAHCQQQHPAFDHANAVFSYDFPVDHLIQQLKYAHQLPVATWAAHEMAHRLSRPNADVIIPMPLHPERVAERGFNQAGEMARRLGRHWKIKVDVDSCLRTRPTDQQTHRPMAERIQNVRGAFTCQRDYRGKAVILLDDVQTTGASLNELARTVRQAGASSIIALTLARTPLNNYNIKQ